MAARLGNMALWKTGQEVLNKYIFGDQLIRSYATKAQKLKGKIAKYNAAQASKRIDSVANSIAAKGFLRPTKPYSPPDNVSDKVKNIFTTLKLPTKSNYILSSLEEKFKVLEACSKDFQHSVPNSELYEIKTIDDIIKFYETPVDTTVPLDAMKNIQLPENLHIQYDYLRFHPETDSMFGGQTAFPKSSTLVTGLKYRDKYRGHIAKRSWP